MGRNRVWCSVFDVFRLRCVRSLAVLWLFLQELFRLCLVV